MLPSALYVAIVVGAILSMVLGVIRYSPFLFGRRWSQAMNYDQKSLEEKKRSARIWYIATFLGLLLTGFFLANLVDYLNIVRFSEVAELSLWLRLACIVPTMLAWVLREDKKRIVFTIGALYHFFALLLMMSVIVFWP